jgi:riboflavin kinase/FMN adenylyltransferase
VSAPVRPGAVTIGAFDGVHTGHRAVLQLVRELADARGLLAVVVTFDRHPAQVVRPESAPCLLTTLEQKVELLEGTGLVDRVEVLTFDEARSRETAEEFVREVLVERLRARLVIVGADFHFGHRRRGNVALLERMGADLGFEVLGLGLVAPEDDPTHTPVSSTRVRACLAAGDVAGAAALLGRPHELRAPVVRGDGRGRALGFPTANLAVPEGVCVPAEGIYAGWARLPDGQGRPAAISVGTRPTFYPGGAPCLVETYLLDFDGDLYGSVLGLAFAARLRDQRRFESPAELVDRMRRDVAEVRRVIGPAPV